jgi:hypothetical protein
MEAKGDKSSIHHLIRMGRCVLIRDRDRGRDRARDGAGMGLG